MVALMILWRPQRRDYVVSSCRCGPAVFLRLSVAMHIDSKPLLQRIFSPLFASAIMACSITLLAGASVISAVPATAGEYNAVLEIGAQAPQWNELEGVDGQKHSWAEVADARCVVVAFTCNSCPYARDVEDRLIELAREFPAPRSSWWRST